MLIITRTIIAIVICFWEKYLFINYECMSRTGSSDVLVNFYEGQTTIVELNRILKTSLGCSPQYITTYE